MKKHIIPKIEAGRSIEAVRNIIKTGQYAEQDSKESLKETFKLITDELEKVDERIHKLKDELQMSFQKFLLIKNGNILCERKKENNKRSRF